MFEVFNYYNNYFGISIDRNKIELGDIEFVEKMKSIKLDLQVENKYILAFNSIVNLSELKIFCSLFNEELKNTNDLSQILKKYNNIFKKIENENLINQYYGLLCELVFIYHCQKNNIDFSRFYQSNNDKFDFNINGKHLEIKKISEQDGSIIISESQIRKMNLDDNIVCVQLCNDSGGNSLNEIFEMIDFDSNQKKFILNKLNELSNILIRIDLENTNFKLLNKRFLPSLDNSFDNLVIDAKYKLFCLSLNKNNEEFFSKIKDIYYGK